MLETYDFIESANHCDAHNKVVPYQTNHVWQSNLDAHDMMGV